MSFKDRLRYLIENKKVNGRHVTAYLIGKETSVSKASISQYMHGTKPSTNKAKILADFFEVSVNWLLYGEGEMVNKDINIDHKDSSSIENENEDLTDEEKSSDNATSRSRLTLYLKSKSMKKYDCEKSCGWTSGTLSQKGELSAEKLADAIRQYPDLNLRWLVTGDGEMVEDQAVVSYTKGRPYYDVDFVCGFDMVENNQSINPDYLINFKKYDTADCWCNATGESMYPLIMSGDIIALKELKDWRRYIPLGEIYGVVTTEHRTIKKIGKSDKEGCIRLIPTNPSPEYAPQDVPIDIILRVYRVMGTMKRL